MCEQDPYAGDEVGIGWHHHRQPRAHAERTLIEPRMPLPDVRPSRSAWVSLVVVLVAACGGGVPQEPQVEAPADARVALRAMALDAPATPPPDASNRSCRRSSRCSVGPATLLRSRFSGALLETDNTGDPQTLGRVGETGKVACAGCHVPGAGFLDNRSARQTVSLAAGWTRRKARSLLDVGQARLLMWDGRHDALYNQVFEALENPVDMNSSRLFAAEQIYKHYRATNESIFGAIPIPLDDKARFPELDGSTTGCSRLLPDDTGALRTGSRCHGIPGDKAEFDNLSSEDDRTEVTRIVVNMGKALGAYERLLSCGPSRFDAWASGAAMRSPLPSNEAPRSSPASARMEAMSRRAASATADRSSPTRRFIHGSRAGRRGPRARSSTRTISAHRRV